MIAAAYRYNLDKSSKKHQCPQCRQKRFVKVVDNETGEYLPDHVGRCDREGRCGYVYTWKQYLADNKQNVKQFISTKPQEPPRPVNYLPISYQNNTLAHYNTNHFFIFLSALFGANVATKLCKQYLIGSAKYWRGATTFPQIDESGNLRQIKVILYNPLTGKRVKEGEEVERWNKGVVCYEKEVTQNPCSLIYGTCISKETKGLNLQQCFFGQHLLAEYPGNEVCVVESEKTAIIASVYFPQYTWIATGGANGCKWREYDVYKAFKGRSVTFFPDYGLYNKKSGKTCYDEWNERTERIKDVLDCKIRVSPLLEQMLKGQERDDRDLADLILQRDIKTGIALTENDYPAIWDYKEIRH